MVSGRSDDVDDILGLGHSGPPPESPHTRRDGFDSRPIERERARIAFEPIPLGELGPCEPPNWVWPGYLARGYVTLLCGLWKAGKTTLLAYLLRDLERGGPLIGDPLGRRVLIVSEEARGHWLRRREDLNLGNGIHLLPPVTLGRPSFPQWHELLACIAAEVGSGADYGLVAFDTLPNLWPVTQENDASEVGDALLPMRQIGDAGAAVLLTHHPRKSEGTEARASRGSGALPGFVDIILELGRYNGQDKHDTRRVLTCYGRFDEHEPEAVLDFDDTGYRIVGDRASTTEAETLDTIADVLPNETPGMTLDEVRDAWPSEPKPGKSKLRGLLNREAGSRWAKTGTGTKGNPYRFHARGFDSRTVPPLVARTESTNSDN